MAVTGYLGVFGHTVLDHILRLARLPDRNTSIQIEGRETRYGGTGANVARAAARLGVPTALASYVGGDFPADYEDALRRDGVDLTDLRRRSGYATPTAWILSDPEGNQVTVIDQGPMRHTARWPILRHTVETSRLVHFGTGRPEYYAKVARFADRLGRTIAFDPAQEIHYVYTRSTLREMIRHTDYLFGNEMETDRVARLLGVSGVRKLLRYVDAVVVTRGERGSDVVTADGTTHVDSAKPRRVVDITGAGDVYRAGFYAGLHRGLDLAACAAVGAAAASFCVESIGPQGRLPSWRQVRTRARASGLL